jgi:hypothetical protein
LAGAYGWGPMGAGFSGGFIAGGIESGNLKGAAYGSVTGGVFGGITGVTPMEGFGSALGSSGYPTTFGVAKYTGHHIVNSLIRNEVGEFAHRHGYSLTEFNLGLFGFSAMGNKIFTSRLADEGWKSTKWGFRGWGMRGELAIPFDIVDTVLALQGLPNASVIDYFSSGARDQPLSGHSLGSFDAANLAGWGFVREAHYFAVPFGKVVLGGPITIGGGDPLAVPGIILNPDAEVVPGVGHPCEKIPGCGV